MPIELTQDEQRVLLQTLQEELGRLKAEINRTEAHEFKEELKGRAPPVITLTTSPSTALAVWRPPAPGPEIVISVIASDSTVTALNGPATEASG